MKAAVNGIPEDLVKDAQVQGGRVERPMSDQRERTKNHGVEDEHRDGDSAFVSLEQRRYSHAQRRLRSEDVH